MLKHVFCAVAQEKKYIFPSYQVNVNGQLFGQSISSMGAKQ